MAALSSSPASLDRYLQEIGRFDPIGAEREAALAETIQEAPPPEARAARQQLVRANLRFVVYVAKEYQDQGLPLADLISAGNTGLIEAAGRFDPSRGFKFISYAVWWVRQRIHRALSAETRTVRRPQNRVDTILQLRDANAELAGELGRAPNLEELADRLDTSPQKLEVARKHARRDRSLEAPLGGEEDRTLGDLLANPDAEAPDTARLAASRRTQVRQALAALPDRQADILRRYFGIGRERAVPLEEIGTRYGLTRERIRQLKEEALQTLRDSGQGAELRAYLG